MENKINEFILYLTERGINPRTVAHDPELMDKYMLEYYIAQRDFCDMVLETHKESPTRIKQVLGV
ncbi:hypothetical protein AB204_12985 [Xenorhabdus khoisanae]|uniref:Uncharacterized protein n=1 Tax=Xenorhabdus khoisanae TaxID=880157 RepID=A0A0J5FRE9_9GAMM|nr:hypothetical protein [Xenorhabdus khoisanae]KMJ44684.1 hypothetical protein AB204_12985 [Xenorhabdus khoisanae]